MTDATMLALTASAPPKMRDEILNSLSMKNERQVISGADRSNIFYMCHKAPLSVTQSFQWLADELLAEKQNCKKYVVYCRSIKACGQLHRMFMEHLQESAYVGVQRAKNKLFAMFHHSTHKSIKSMLVDTFGKPESIVRVIFATVAFGLGIDCPDIFMVINWGASRSFEGYYQESGRAGRNPILSAYALMYFHGIDIAEKATEKEMREYCTNPTNKCRRQIINAYLTPNEKVEQKQVLHDCCDICLEKCECGNCPILQWKLLGAAEKAEAADEDVSPITVEQQQDIEKALKAYREGYDYDYGLTSGALLTGLDDTTITRIATNSHHFHCAEDLFGYIYDTVQQSAVIDIILDITGT